MLYAIPTYKIIHDNKTKTQAQEITSDNVAQMIEERGAEFTLELIKFLLSEREEIETLVDDVFTHGDTLIKTIKNYSEAQYEEGYSEGESMGAIGAYDEGYADGQAERD